MKFSALHVSLSLQFSSGKTKHTEVDGSSRLRIIGVIYTVQSYQKGSLPKDSENDSENILSCRQLVDLLSNSSTFFQGNIITVYLYFSTYIKRVN